MLHGVYSGRSVGVFSHAQRQRRDREIVHSFNQYCLSFFTVLGAGTVYPPGFSRAIRLRCDFSSTLKPQTRLNSFSTYLDSSTDSLIYWRSAIQLQTEEGIISNIDSQVPKLSSQTFFQNCPLVDGRNRI
jgi:hypothetical protein